MVNEWGTASIGDFLDFKNGLNKGKEFFGHGTPIVNYTDVYNHRGLHRSDVKGTVELQHDEIARYEVKKGDVFFTRTSETPEEVGLTSVLLDVIPDCSFSGFVLRGRPKNDMFLPEYCKYCFSTKEIREKIILNCTYTTRALTNGTQLSKIAIPVPPKSEQNAIASALSDVDELIEDLQKLIRKKKDIRQGTMQMLVTGKKRLDGFSGEWRIVKLNEISEIQDGTHGSFKRTDSGYMFLSAKNVFNNMLVISNNESYISERDYLSIVANGYPRDNDILMSCVGTIGRCCIFDGNNKVAFQRSVAFIRCNSTVSVDFVLYALQTEIVHNQLAAAANASAQAGVYLGALSSIEVCIPENIEEQKVIAEIIKDEDVEIQQLEEKLRKYEKVKQGMMEELLTGKVRLS